MVSSVTGLNCFVRLHSCENAMDWSNALCEMMLFCVKSIVKESHNFELTCLKKKNKDKEEIILMTFCFGTFMSLGVLFIIKTVKDEWYIVIEAYKFPVFEILFVLSYIV